MCAKRPHVPSLSHACDVRFGQLTRAQSIKDTPLTATGRTRTHLPGARRTGTDPTPVHPTRAASPRRRRETARIGRSDLRRIKRTPHVSTELSHESAVSCDVGRDTATHEREHTTLLVSPVDRDSRAAWHRHTPGVPPRARPFRQRGHARAHPSAGPSRTAEPRRHEPRPRGERARTLGCCGWPSALVCRQHLRRAMEPLC